MAGTADGEVWLYHLPAVVQSPHKDWLEGLLLPEAGCSAALDLQLDVVQQSWVQAPSLLCPIIYCALPIKMCWLQASLPRRMSRRTSDT